jgi:hypothetical protein
MKHIQTLLLFLLISLTSFGQKTHSFDLDHIRILANQDIYTILFDRFIANDTTLTVDDYAVIYYGQAYRDNFQPHARHDSICALNMYLQNNRGAVDFTKVL